MLLHPLDFLGKDDEVGLSFFPAMGLHRDHKLRLVGQILAVYSDHYQIVSLKEHADRTVEVSRASTVECYNRITPD
jgi:hypothetical protein